MVSGVWWGGGGVGDARAKGEEGGCVVAGREKHAFMGLVGVKRGLVRAARLCRICPWREIVSGGVGWEGGLKYVGKGEAGDRVVAGRGEEALGEWLGAGGIWESEAILCQFCQWLGIVSGVWWGGREPRTGRGM